VPFPDDHPLSEAFLANRLERLSELIAVQGQGLLAAAGLEMPSRAVSLVLLVGERGGLSAADAAAALGLPHQLVTQRAELLIGLGLVERSDDPSDGRRKILKLSAGGLAQHAKLRALLADAARAFEALFDEIGCDLSAVSATARAALERVPLQDRIRAGARS